jgi:hypothetical protein
MANEANFALLQLLCPVVALLGKSGCRDLKVR